ncbi:transcriptional regulator [Eggerthellaceae bacterium zg-893]|uniref:Transcriptional regulator n=1 Tax=Xiamenia xianingshaonis TaxID=2682776 RepID=A0ABX0IJG8_9ACTN|nr:transcriptional regulator [Eggerthellaceae bacterium zg-893]NHM14403.1 transcriptional regulator [Xiamenia xianingshaonis]
MAWRRTFYECPRWKTIHVKMTKFMSSTDMPVLQGGLNVSESGPLEPEAANNEELDRYSRESGRYTHAEAEGSGKEEDPQLAESAADHASAEELYPVLAKRKRRNRILKRVAVIVLSVLLVFGSAAGALAYVYTNSLDNALAFEDEKHTDKLDTSLITPATGEPYYVLLLGSDSYEQEDRDWEIERTDVMMLVRIDPEESKVTMVSIPRDTPYVWEDGGMYKINDAYHLGGASASVDAVSKLTGVPISHVAVVGFSSLADVVDGLGGVTVNVDTELTYQDALTKEWITLEPGEQKLDGSQAQIFARARHEYVENQDVHRQNNVRTLAMAIIKEIVQKPLVELPDAALSVAECVQTDMKTADVLSLAMAFATNKDDMKIYSATGPSAGDFMEEHNGMWLCYENPEGWAALMESVDAGEEPAEIDYEATQIVPGAEEASAAEGTGEEGYVEGDEYGYYDEQGYYHEY